MQNNTKENIYGKIELLLDDYKDNETMIAKMEDYIVNQLPTIMRNINNTHIERENRKNMLEENSTDFINNYVKSCPYYYCSASEIFFEYKDNHYNCVREDTVLCNILGSISKEKVLLPWKYKIKTSVMKRIKERDIFTSTPNSETIQYIIHMMKNHFGMNKETTKYFLTVIGDIMMKKNTFTYFINSSFKSLLRELSNNSYLLFGPPNVSAYFKFKYFEHMYKDCRLIDYKGSLCTYFDKTNIYKHTTDCMVVACYFSTKYGCADKFINDFCKDLNVQNHAMYLKDRNEETIMMDFLQHMTEPSNSNESCIGWKEMSYLWKTYNEIHNFPGIMFHTTLKELLIKYFGEKYDGEKDRFLNITSVHLPIVVKFLEFWNKEIYESEDQLEYEVDEIYNLLQDNYKMPTLTEDKLLGLIRHYYPDVIIDENKYFLNIGCHLWDKKTEATTYIDNYNYNLTHSSSADFDELYESYKKDVPNPKRRLSKHYFEKFIAESNDIL